LGNFSIPEHLQGHTPLFLRRPDQVRVGRPHRWNLQYGDPELDIDSENDDYDPEAEQDIQGMQETIVFTDDDATAAEVAEYLYYAGAPLNHQASQVAVPAFCE
jgi:hypothetical protein